jgi:hypothetical protein
MTEAYILRGLPPEWRAQVLVAGKQELVADLLAPIPRKGLHAAKRVALPRREGAASADA